MFYTQFNIIPKHTPFVFATAFGVGVAIAVFAVRYLLRHHYIEIEFDLKERNVSKLTSSDCRLSKEVVQTFLFSQIDTGTLKVHFDEVLSGESEEECAGLELESKKEVYHEFVNVHCASETVIKVDLNGDEKKIHANLLTGKREEYINSQCPATRDSLCDERLELFWKMAFENSSLICDLAGPKKIPEYYPTKDQKKQHFSAMTVSYVKEENKPHAKIVTYDVEYGGKTKQIRRLIPHSSWPSNEYVKPEVLKSLYKNIQGCKNGEPPIFHDRSGLGWAATLLTACEMIEAGCENWVDPQTKIDALVKDFRKQRGDAHFIQTYEQYCSLHDLVTSKSRT